MRQINDLKQMQGLPLHLKVELTKARLRQWVGEWGEDGVYISFSGGKDSTVLMDIARKMYPSIPAVFVNTGLEYPEIVSFVKTFDNVEIIKPEKNFKKVIEEFGYPFISKEVSECVWGARRYLNDLLNRQTDRQSNPRYPYFFDKLCGQGKYASTIEGGADSKYRKLRGIGEFDGRQNAERQRRCEPSSRKDAGNSDDGQACDASGDYP